MATPPADAIIDRVHWCKQREPSALHTLTFTMVSRPSLLATLHMPRLFAYLARYRPREYFKGGRESKKHVSQRTWRLRRITGSASLPHPVSRARSLFSKSKQMLAFWSRDICRESFIYTVANSLDVEDRLELMQKGRGVFLQIHRHVEMTQHRWESSCCESLARIRCWAS